MVNVAFLHEAHHACGESAGLFAINAYTMSASRRQQARPARHEAGTLELNERDR
jgi:hypothetical protein